MNLDVAYRTVPCRGYDDNGDCAIHRREGNVEIIAVFDALGHGARAAPVASRAQEYLMAADVSRGVDHLMDELDATLRGTRGAQGLICRIDAGRLEGCGVGNVDMRASGTRIPIMLTPGIIGAGIRKLRVFSSELTIGDRIAIFSDGISMRTPLDSLRHLSAERACQELMELHRKPHDDATILIADVERRAA
jgi:phosphoserine phosphatase RsbX